MNHRNRRVLLAASRDWTGPARLPEVLARAGLEVSLLHSGAAHIAASSHLSRRIDVDGGAAGVAAALAGESAGCDRVIVLDEPLLEAICDRSDEGWTRAVLPAGDASDVRALIDKTLFAARAREAGLPRPACAVVRDVREFDGAVDRIGLPVIVKGPRGQSGSSVRGARDGEGARAAAAEIGEWPLLVEENVSGQLGIVACLFSHGRVAAGLVVEKLRDVRPLGPSSIVRIRAGRSAGIDLAERVGEEFSLDGFASLDVVTPLGCDPILIEVNARPVPILRLARRAGIDIGKAFADMLDGHVQSIPLVPARDVLVRQFPQELQRWRHDLGGAAGTLRWAADPRDWRELPWGDQGLFRKYLR